MQLQGVEVIPIQNDFQVIVSSTELSVPVHMIKAIESILQTAIKQPGSKLFDGKILSVTNVSPTALTCSIVPYHFFYAQRQSNIIRDALQIKVAAVSGLILHDQLLYFGRRSLSTTQYPGFIELAPSGSIDPDLVTSNGQSDFRRQLVDELREELGINGSSVSSIDPLFLAFDNQEQTWDICCRITLLPTADINIGNDLSLNEYKEILTIPLSQSADFLKAHSKQMVPTTQVILQKLFPQ